MHVFVVFGIYTVLHAVTYTSWTGAGCLHHYALFIILSGLFFTALVSQALAEPDTEHPAVYVLETETGLFFFKDTTITLSCSLLQLF